MIFSTALRRGIRSSVISSRATPLVRNASTTASKGPGIPPGALSAWYNIFGKSNAAYISWIVGGVIFAEFVTGTGIDTLWGSMNNGNTYDTVDWSKFIVEDDDDEDDDEEDDEEEEEEDEDEDDE